MFFPRRVMLGALILLTAAGPLSAEPFKYPLDAVAAPDGAIYVADLRLPGVWRIKDGQASVFHQASKKFRTPLNAIRCLALDAKGNLLAGDSATREIYRFDKEGKATPVLKPGFPKGVGIGIPMAIAADEDNNLFVADLETQRVWKVPAGGGEPQEFALVTGPRGLAFDGQGRLWVVSQGGRDQLLRFTPDGKKKVIVEGTPFRFAHNVAVDDDDEAAYVSDGYAKTIWKVGPDGKPEKWISGDPLVNPVGLAWNGEKLLIVDSRANALFEATPEGKLSTLVGAAAKK